MLTLLPENIGSISKIIFNLIFHSIFLELTLCQLCFGNLLKRIGSQSP